MQQPMLPLNARVRLSLAALAGTVAVLGAAAAAEARDATVRSFDGTPIIVSFHPAQGLASGQRAPTVLMTHGWGGNRETDPDAASSEATGNVGAGPMRRAGFNVLTWDSRGFGQSGGVVTVDHKDFEGRDVQALIDWLAQQPEARLDAPGDPRVGMQGASYAGGIELVSAAIEPRIDAIAPVIAWHSLLTSLYKEDTVKGGWSLALYGGGVPAAGLEGIVSPAGIQTGALDPHIHSAFASGTSTGKLSAEDRAWFDSRGPAALVEQIKVPTMLIQGTADTLFTPSEAIRNYEILRRNGVPVKMLWFCGGHGACLTGHGEDGHVEGAVLAWLRRHLAGEAGVDTGPRFEWLADDARWRSAPEFPPGRGVPVAAEGSGTLRFAPGDALSGTPITAGPAANAVNVPIAAPAERETLVVGEPKLTLTYSGTGSAPAGHVFAQIVDEQRGQVVGNQVTPVAVTLDGAEHTAVRSLEGIAAAMKPGNRYRLQVIGGSQVYGPVRTAAQVAVARARIELPTPSADLGAGGGPAGGRTCLSRRRFTIRLREPRRGRLRSARVTIAGKGRVKVHRRHGRLRATIDLRGRQRRRVTVRIVSRTTRGRVLREKRVYRTCVPTRERRR
jgi:ABC-2 type transport system ATP-binding protein